MYSKEEFKKIIREINEIPDVRVKKILESILLEITENNNAVKKIRKDIIEGKLEEALQEEPDERRVFENITQIMHEIGIPANLKGYYYIREAVCIVVEDMEKIKFVTKELYPYIAENHDTESSRVERAIRHAIEVSWLRGNIDVLNEIFGYTVSTQERPTNAEFIGMLADRVRVNLKMY